MRTKQITITFTIPDEGEDWNGFAEIFAEDLKRKGRIESKGYVILDSDMVDGMSVEVSS